MSLTKTERLMYAGFLAKTGLRARIVVQSSLITHSQCRKLFEELEYHGVHVAKKNGPKTKPRGLIRSKAQVLEASLLMLCYTRRIEDAVHSNQVDTLNYLRAYKEYISIRQDYPSAFTVDPFEISDGYLLCESLRNPDSDSGGIMLHCPNCSTKFYNAIDQRNRHTQCPWCAYKYPDTKIHHVAC